MKSSLTDDQHEIFCDACYKGLERKVRLLLQKGADVNWPSLVNGLTPLQSASFQVNLGVMAMLLEQGADPNRLGIKRLMSPKRVFWPPLLCAYDNEQAMNLLLSHGAHIDAQDSKENQTALHLAAADNIVSSVIFLLDRGASRNLLDHKGRTPLQCAVGLESADVVEAWGLYEATERAHAAIEDSSGFKQKPL